MSMNEQLEKFAKAEADLRKQLQELEDKKRRELEKHAGEVYQNILEQAQQFASMFNASQRATLASLFGGAGKTGGAGKKTAGPAKYLLDGKPFTGRGRKSEATIKLLKAVGKKPMTLNPKWVELNPDQAEEFKANPVTGEDMLPKDDDKKATKKATASK